MNARFGIPAALLALLLATGPASATVTNDQVQSQHIREADGTSAQNTNSGAGVKTGHIQNSAVTSAKIQDGQVMNADLGANAISTDKILDATVSNADLANGAVTDAKITGPISATKISSTGLNADTVDGNHASAFAAAIHTHAQADVTGLAASLTGKSDVTHTHKYGKVAIVAQSGGDYTSPVTAMSNISSWCGTPSSTNPCLLKIMPGVYDIGSSTLFMSEFVDIEGSGVGVTKITSSLNAVWEQLHGTVDGANNAELRSLTVENRGGDMALYLSAIAIYLPNCSPRITNVAAVAANAYGAYAVFAANGSAPLISETVLTAYASSTGSYALAVLNGAQVTVERSRLSAKDGLYPFGINNQGILNITDSQVTGSIGIYSSGLTVLRADRCVIEGETSIISSGSTMVGASKLIGPIAGGTNTCVASYSGDYLALDQYCQPVP